MFTAEPCARKKPEVLPENRVGDFFSVSFTCTGENPFQTLEPHRETSTTDTTTVSGVVYWLSKDPIGISGGLNQYVFCSNNPVNFVDPFGLVDMNLDSQFEMNTYNGQSISTYDIAEKIDIDGQFTTSGHGYDVYAFSAKQFGVELGDYGWNGTTPVTLLACDTALRAMQLSNLYPDVNFTGFNVKIYYAYDFSTGKATWGLEDGTSQVTYRNGKRVTCGE